MKIKITYQNDGNGRGWNAWCGLDRQWQPIIGFENEGVMPELEDVLFADPLTSVGDDVEGLEVIE
jgi:hypothetical protein